MRMRLAMAGVLAMVSVGLWAMPEGVVRLKLRADQISCQAKGAEMGFLVDEQGQLGEKDAPGGQPQTAWKLPKGTRYPVDVILDLGEVKPICKLWLFDTFDIGDVHIYVGKPGAWIKKATCPCDAFKSWRDLEIKAESRYVRLEITTYKAVFAEVALDVYTPQAWDKIQRRIAEEEALAKERVGWEREAKANLARRPSVNLPPFGQLVLVDEIVCGQKLLPRHRMESYPENTLRVETILGRKAWVIPPCGKGTQSSALKFTLGDGQLLKPGKHYVLTLDYPEDKPRSYTVRNLGCETTRGFHTGATVGDALSPRYVDNHPESLVLPLSGRYETWKTLFNLHSRYYGVRLGEGMTPQRVRTPNTGFDLAIAQLSADQEPLSAGIAVHAVRLYEVQNPTTLAATINYPEGLPKRRIFWREEMSDGVIQGAPAIRGVDNPSDWYAYKMDLMSFLAINTFTKDLFEFGHCQHWDPEDWRWMHYDASLKHVWQECVEAAGKRGLDVLPYYEYSGARGPNGLGPKRRCKPLGKTNGKGHYTHIWWSESANVDLTAPEALEDFKRVLDLTILKFKSKARIVGAWIRPRNSAMPVSFADETIARFCKDTGQAKAVTRADLQRDRALYGRYLDWWHLRRRRFLAEVRDYLRERNHPDDVVLFTGSPSEPGPGFAGGGVVADRPDLWRGILSRLGDKRRVVTVEEIVRNHLYYKELTSPVGTWGAWEWHHSIPADDPFNYRDQDGILLTHPFNRLYTVSDPKTLEAYRCGSGQLALVRHYSLNENMMDSTDGRSTGMMGYFVSDYERAREACMQAEAVAVANGDPTSLAYLSSNCFNRGFPEFVRDFNANFLALPALPSRRIPDASSNPAVAVRRIDTPKGIYLAVVNTSAQPVQDLRLTLPAGAKTVTALASGKTRPATASITLTLRPYQLLALRVN